MIVKRTPDERKAYLNGFEMCARCLKDYLTDEGKQKIEGFLTVMRIATEINNSDDYTDLADIMGDLGDLGMEDDK